MNREVNIEGKTLNFEGERIFYSGARLMLLRLHEGKYLKNDWLDMKKVSQDKMTTKISEKMYDAGFLRKVLESQEALELFMADCDDEILPRWYTDKEGNAAVNFTTPHEREEGKKAIIDLLFENIKGADE